MALRQKLQARQTQSLTLTPQLQQSIKLLQLNRDELAALIESELEGNPLLRREAGAAAPLPPPLPGAPSGGSRMPRLNWPAPRGAGKSAPPSGAQASLEDGASTAPSLQDHLLLQAQLELRDPESRRIALALIDALDEAGYLAAELEDLAAQLAVARAEVERVLARVQHFDPAGVFARGLAECLRLQLEEEEETLPRPMAALLDNLDLLARGDRRQLCARCGVDDDTLDRMISKLRRLDPKPGARFLSEPVEAVVPDLVLRRAGNGGWQVELNEEALPQILVDHGYREEIAATLRRREDKSYLGERLRSANWLVRALQQRAATVLKIGQAIVARQEAFFEDGVEGLKPLTLRHLAEDAGLHESTVSRAMAGKYMETPGGLYPLGYFLNTALPGLRPGESFAAERVRHRIRGLIAAEEPAAPLSDDSIAARLEREGIRIARRTVAKYRDTMGLPGAAKRRRRRGGAGSSENPPS